jgi:hypothetical protein
MILKQTFKNHFNVLGFTLTTTLMLFIIWWYFDFDFDFLVVAGIFQLCLTIIPAWSRMGDKNKEK